jgi:SHS2 domain-containing protein
MAKHNYTFDHPSDIGLAARADSLGELMEALAEGLAGEICAPDQVAAAENRTLEVSVEAEETATAAPDYEALAVDFLTAVMNLIQVRHFMVREVAVQIPTAAHPTPAVATETQPRAAVPQQQENSKPQPGAAVPQQQENSKPQPGAAVPQQQENSKPQPRAAVPQQQENSKPQPRAAVPLVAKLTGEAYDPSRHEIKVEIKAVTYHQLTIKQEGGQWVGRVILDI